MKSDESKSKDSVWNWRSRRRAKRNDEAGSPTSSDEGAPSPKPHKGRIIQFQPHAKRTSTVALVDILDAFRSLEDPQSRIFAGVMFGTSWQAEEGEEHTRVFSSLGESAGPVSELPHFPLVSGVASPGSRIDVSLADEAGVVQSEITVFTDAAGNWIAPFEGIETTETTWLVEITILPAAWSGAVESRKLIVSLPGGNILSHDDVNSTEEGELYGVVFSTDGNSIESDSSQSW